MSFAIHLSVLNIKILYRAGKDHINADTLSQLAHRSVQTDDDVYGFSVAITDNGDS